MHEAFLTDHGKLVYAALSDPRFHFRTLVGLAAATKLSGHEVMVVLNAAAGNVRVTQNRNSVPLYCLPC